MATLTSALSSQENIFFVIVESCSGLVLKEDYFLKYFQIKNQLLLVFKKNK